MYVSTVPLRWKRLASNRSSVTKADDQLFLLKRANEIIMVLFFQNSSLRSRHSSYPIQTACSGVWKKTFLLHTPPGHIIGPNNIIASPKQGRKKKITCSPCFDHVGVWVSAYSVLWMNKLLWRGLRSARAKFVFDNRGCYQQDPLLQGYRKNIFTFGSALCVAAAGQPSSRTEEHKWHCQHAQPWVRKHSCVGNRPRCQGERCCRWRGKGQTAVTENTRMSQHADQL